jgi:transcriptional regulator GlxA family with amidase domain
VIQTGSGQPLPTATCPMTPAGQADIPTMNIGLLLFPAAEELDCVGPWEMFTLWQQLASGPERCLFVAETAAPVLCANGMVVMPHESFASCPPLDVQLVPCGRGTPTEAANPALIGFVQQQAQHCQAVLSVCAGAFILHSAGTVQLAATVGIRLGRSAKSCSVS